MRKRETLIHTPQGVGWRVVHLATTGTEALSSEFTHHQFGVTGIFLKPLDPAIILQVLKGAFA